MTKMRTEFQGEAVKVDFVAPELLQGLHSDRRQLLSTQPSDRVCAEPKRPKVISRTLSAATVLLALQTGCALGPMRGYMNEPFPDPPKRLPLDFRPDVPRATLQYRIGASVPSVFVGLSLSGGGSRAANFGAAVMEQLASLGFLDDLTAISSVSGGSLTAAYYAINGRRSFESLKTILSMDFFGRWLIASANPISLVKTWTTYYTATDTMTTVFNSTLFHGATYSELGDSGPRLLINATDASSGRPFTFTDETFQINLGSALASYPIAAAVMASGAFPGVFADVTLKSYRPEELSESVREATLYSHLIDGGAIDNLGIRSLILAARNAYLASERQGNPLRGCFLFIVDAHQEPGLNSMALKLSPRGPVDRIVDMNVLDAVDSLMSTTRDEMLRKIGLKHKTYDRWISPVWSFELFGPAVESDPETESRVLPYPLPLLMAPGGSSPFPEELKNQRFACTVWHIGFQRLRHAGSPSKTPPLASYRFFLERLVSAIATHYKLTGPKGCSPKFLQDALYAAARVLIREDDQALHEACAWFSDRGLLTFDTCYQPVPPVPEELMLSSAKEYATYIPSCGSTPARLENPDRLVLPP